MLPCLLHRSRNTYRRLIIILRQAIDSQALVMKACHYAACFENSGRPNLSTCQSGLGVVGGKEDPPNSTFSDP